MVITSWLAALTSRLFGKKKTIRTRNRHTQHATQATQTAEILETRTLLTAPVAVDDSGYSVDEDSSIAGADSVLGNDTDDEGNGTITGASLDSGPAHAASFHLYADGTFDYTPEEDFNGTDTFTYFAIDEDSESSATSATVTITVNQVNDDGTFGGDTSGSGNEDTVISGTLGFSDSRDGDSTPNFTVSSDGTNGSATIDSGSGDWEYTPDDDFNGSDSFQVTVTDDDGNTETVTINVTVDQVDDAGSFGGNTSGSGNEDTDITGTLTYTDAADGVTNPNFTVSTPAGSGTASINSSSGAWTYTPDGDFNGNDSFNVTVTDDDGNTDTVTINVTVDQVDDAGSFGGDTSGSGNEDTDITGTLTYTDTADGVTTPNFNISSPAGSGTASINASSGAWTYTPNGDFHGSDSFNVTVSDDDGNTDTVTINVTVDQVNDAGTFGGDTSGSGNEDTDITGTLTFSDTTDGSTTPNFTVTSNASNGTASINASSGDWTYTPDDDYNGLDSFVVTVTDDDGNTETVTINVTVDQVDDTGSFGGHTTGSGNEDTDITGTLTYTDAADGVTTPNFTVSDQASNGTASINSSSGVWTYTPNDDFNGSDSFQVTVTDDDGNTDSVTINVTVDQVNDAGTFGGDTSGSGNEDTDITGTLTFTDAADGFTSSLFLLSLQASNGTATINSSTGAWVYTPDDDYNGVDDFQVTVVDDDGNSETVTINVTVDQVNDTGTFGGNTSGTGDEDTDITGTLTFSDAADGATDPDFTVTTDPTNGTASINSTTGAWTYTPDADYFGPDSFEVTVTDDDGNTETQTISLTIDPVNDAPVAYDTFPSINEDTVLNSSVSVFDVESNSLTYTVVNDVDNGVLVLNNNGTYTYTPNSNFHGTDSFTFKVNDGDQDSNTATVTITVISVNDVPVAGDDSATTSEDNEISINVLINDSDADNDTLYLFAGPGQHGTTFVDNHGTPNDPTDDTITYTPDDDYNGPDSFTYIISDNHGGLTTATVNITVTSVNDAPVVDDDNYTTDEDTPLIVAAAGVLGNDSDSHNGAPGENNTPLVATVVDQPEHGIVSLNSNGSFTYTPDDDYHGSDSFTYQVTDDLLDVSEVATVYITVQSINDTPTFTVGDDQTVDEDSGFQCVPNFITDSSAGADDESGQALNYIVSNDNPTLFSVAPSISPDGKLTYQSAPNQNGSATVTVQIHDDGGGATDTSATQTFTITITSVNDAADVTDDSYTVDEDTTLTVDLLEGVLANDSDSHGGTLNENNTPFNLCVVDDPLHGDLTLNDDGSFTYIPDADYNGTDSFTYKVIDSLGAASSVATVTLTVTSVNDVPEVANDSYSTNEDTVLNILVGDGVLANDSDYHDGAENEDNTPLIAEVVDDPMHGDLTLNDDGSFTFTPDDDYNGTDSFTYRVTDFLTGVSSTATVNLTIHSVNDAPTVADDYFSLAEDAEFHIDPGGSGVLANDSDSHGGTANENNTPLVASVVDEPLHGQLTFNADGTFTYTPDPDYNGTDSFTYKVTDDLLAVSTLATVHLTINSVNDVPDVEDDCYKTNEDTLLTVPVENGLLANDSDYHDGAPDEDNTPLVAAVVTGPDHGDLTLNDDGSFSYDPDDDYYGDDVFTYRVTDSKTGVSSTATVYLTVRSVNDVPTFTVGPNIEVLEDHTSTTVDLISNGGFEDGLFDWVTQGIDTEPPYGGNLFYSQTGTLTPYSSMFPSGPGPVDEEMNYTVQAPSHDDYAAMSDQVGPGAAVLYQDFVVPFDIASATLSFNLYLNNHAEEYFNQQTFDPFSDPNQQARVDIISSSADPFSTDEEDVLMNIFQTCRRDSAEFGYTTITADLTCLLASHAGETLRLRFASVNTEFFFEMGVDNVQLEVVTTETATVSGWATGITAGGGESQNLCFEVTNDNNDLFLEQPSIDPTTGDLTYKLVPDASGTALVTVTLRDNGGTRRGGVNTTAPQTFTITAATVNDAPTFTKGLYEDVKEDSGAHTVSAWATSINAGNPNTSDEGGQELTFTVTNDNNDLFAVQPSIDPLTGDLTYTLADNAFGYANVYVTLSDNGGTDDGGSDTSETQMFTIIVRSVNDAPSFELPAIPDQTILEDAGPQTVLAFASNILAGPDNESEQELCFKIRTSDDCMFTTLPYIDPVTGDLTYEIAPNANGDVTVYVTLKDDGGRDDCGENRSAQQCFTIHVTPVQDPPVATDDYVSATEDTHLGIYVLDNDSDADDEPLAIFVNSPLHGSASVNDNGTPGDFTDDYIDYTPAANYNGPDSFTYKIDDPNGGTSTATVHINVSSVNDAPVANTDGYSVNEDTTLSISAAGVLGNDSDSHSGAPEENNGPLTAILISGTTNGIVALNTDGSFTYTPNTNYSGPDSFKYVALDSYSATSNEVTVYINVRAVNDAPLAQNGTATTQEDQAVNSSVSGSDIDSGSITFQLVSDAGHGHVTMNPNGTYTYTPDANFNGTDSFTFKANDGSLDSDPATVTVTVTPVNDLPIALPDSYSTLEDTALVVTAPGILANDSDLENNGSLTAVIDSIPAHGTVVFNADGSFTYTPAANFSGTDTLAYHVVDSQHGVSNVALINLTIVAVNDAPVAAASSHTLAEDSSLISNVSSTDVDGPAATYSLVSGPSNGQLNFQPDGSYVYVPNANFHGTDSFQFKANDGSADSDPATVSLTITPVNDAPVAYDDAADTTEDNATSGQLGGTDIDNEPVTFSVVTPPAHGTVTLNPTTGEAVYTPNANYFGTDSFTYKVNDGTADSNVATVSITIQAVNDAPVASDASISVAEDGEVSNSVPVVDVDSGVLTYSVVTQPTHGTVTLDLNTGAYTYTPESNYNGTDSFTFQANDGLLVSGVGTVNVTITPVNDAPTVSGGSQTTQEDVPVSGTLSGADIDNVVLTFSVVTPPTNGTVVITNSATGAYTYTPNANYFGSDSFTFKVNDGSADSAPATINLTITAVNDAPAASTGTLTTPEDVAGGGTLGGTDVDSGALTFTVLTQPTHGTVVITNASTGAYTYTPELNFNGSDSFTYKISDGLLDSLSITVNITVTPVNDAPLASDGELSTAEETPADRTMNGSDIDGDTSTVSIVTQPAHGTVVITNATTGAYTYTPALNYVGPDSFTFKLTNGGLDSNIATITINVTQVNDAPVVNDFAFTIAENSPALTAVGTVTASDVDAGDSRVFSITGGNSSGAFAINPGTGQITVVNSSALNFEAQSVFNLTVTVMDGGGLTDTAAVTITVTNVDEPPVLSLPSAASIYVVKKGAVIIDRAASVADPETPTSTYAGGSLTVQVTGNANTNDRVEIIDQGPGTNTIDVSSKKIYFNSVHIGTIVTYGAGSTALSIDFTQDATEAAVKALLKVVIFRNTSSNPPLDQRTITFTLRESDEDLIATATQHVDVVKTITPRTLQLANTALNYTNGSAAAVIDNTATVSGGVSPGFNGASLSVMITSGVSSNNQMGIANVGGITLSGKDVLFNGNKIGRATISKNTLTVSFTGFDATQAAVQALLRAISFSTTSTNTSLADRVATFKLTDITGSSSTPVTKTIHVSATT